MSAYECGVFLGHKDSKSFLDSKNFQIRPFLRKFSHQNEQKCFWKNKHLYMHSSTQISHAGIIFDADSEFKVRFPIL